MTPTRQQGSERIASAIRALAERRDRRTKIGLLLVSLATLALLVAAAVQENVLPAWRLHQKRYARILRSKATDAWGEKIARDFRVEMRQIVLPELETIDRCVSCHTGIDDPRMTDVPNPHAVHPGRYLEWHDPSRFGCTPCHRGQGRAMTFEEAKAEGHHWDYPLLPTELLQSSCGLCHAPQEVAGKGGDVYAHGAALFDAKGCASCHQIAGRGGSLGPALDNEGLKLTGQLPMARVTGPRTLPQWLVEHFDDPQRIVAGSQMPPPALSRQETVALTTYMLSLQGRDLPESYLSPERHLAAYARAHPAPMTGQELYNRYCSTCHDTGTIGRYDKFFKRFIPAVRGETYRSLADPAYVAANIREGRRGTIMPPWGASTGGLSEDEILRLTEYLLGRDELTLEAIAPRPEADAAGRESGVVGDPERGGAIFVKTCSGCHGTRGEGKLGPSLDSPAFQRNAGHDLLFMTIAGGRHNTAMPAFLAKSALDGGDVDDLIAFIRTLGAKGGEHARR
jgi:mono/diheme cytochrome c family protein